MDDYNTDKRQNWYWRFMDNPYSLEKRSNEDLYDLYLYVQGFVQDRKIEALRELKLAKDEGRIKIPDQFKISFWYEKYSVYDHESNLRKIEKFIEVRSQKNSESQILHGTSIDGVDQLTNLTQRVLMLHELGIIDHLKSKYEGNEGVENESKFAILISFILDIESKTEVPKITKYLNRIKNDLNAFFSKTAKNKIKKKLIELDIEQ